MSTTTITTAPLPTGVWNFDLAHTEVTFVARHLMVAKVRGRFPRLDGEIRVAEPLEDSSVEVTLATGDVTTGSPDRDAHIRSADFLDVERYPEMTFRSTAVRRVGDDYEIDGDLTIKDVTRPVTLAVDFEGVTDDPWGGRRAGFSAKTTIDRERWGLTWNVALETGGVLVGKDIDIVIDVEAVQA